MAEIGNLPLEKRIPFPIEENKLFDIVTKTIESNSNYFEVKKNQLLNRISFSYKPIDLHPKFIINCQIENINADKTSLTTTISHSNGMLTGNGQVIASKINDEFFEFLNEIMDTGELNLLTIEQSKKRFAGVRSLFIFLIILFAALILFIIYVTIK